MTFEDGFLAIAKVQSSSKKLADSVERISQLDDRLNQLHQTQSAIETALGETRSAISVVERAASSLSEQRELFEDLAKRLPASTTEILNAAETRLADKHSELSALIDSLPTLLENAVEAKLATIHAQLEARITERLRDELKDTRTTMREAYEISASRSEAQLEDMQKEIIAEMPRTMLGRKGRS